MKPTISVLILLASANVAFADLNGTYRSEYRNDKCGTLIFSANEIRYEYGKCGQSPSKIVSDISREDSRLHVDGATYDFIENEDGSLEGLWRLGGHFGWLTFHKIKG
ncbi:MAG: hypothetical protein AAF429_05105 [Pseudomonadota bacterium]